MSDMIAKQLWQLALLVPLLIARPVQATEHLSFCYDPYPPYAMGTEGPPTGGLKVELLSAVMDRTDGLTADVVLMPWRRCQEAARTGDVDGILPLFRSTERDAFLAFTDGTFREDSVFFYRRAAFSNGVRWSDGYTEIAQLRLGMLNGGHIDGPMQSAFAAHQPILYADDLISLFLMLIHDRIDLVALDVNVGLYNLRQNDWSDVLDHSTQAISSQHAYFGLSRASGADRHLDAFNRAIAELHSEGWMETILAEPATD